MTNKSVKNLATQTPAKSYPQRITKEGFEEFTRLQKQYIDKGDKLNADRISSLEDIIGLETGSPFFVAAYAKGTHDNTPLFTKGNPEIAKKFDFFLLDTSDNSGEVTTPVGKLMKNNLLHFANGNYAPVVGITQAMYDECMTNAIYTKDGENYTETYATGAFNAAAQWAIDKVLISEGKEPTALYKKVRDEYVPVTHVLRPWETTETKYTIGIAHAQDLYILDNMQGVSGTYWKGIFTEPRIWDGIDLSRYKLARTAIGPCPMTTVVESGVTKCRNFFYLYEAAHNNCKSNAGLIPNNPFYNKDRHYPRIRDVNQINNMNWSRANNADTTKSFPFAEGGWWATNAHILALELLAKTRYLHQANLFGSGISSNDGTHAVNFYTSGGARLRKKTEGEGEAWQYKAWDAISSPYHYALQERALMCNLITYSFPIEACMESQLAASMATELGIAPTEDTSYLNTFKFYGDTYYYMNVPGFAGLQDGDMNVRVYKVQTADVEGYNDANEPTTFEFELIYRMSLFNGVNLVGDIWSYNGGGIEMVGTRKYITSTVPVDVYLQPDQKQWHHETVVRKNIGEVFDFENSYMKVGEYETLGTTYTLERMSNSPVRIKGASNITQGECYHMVDPSNWNYGQRARMMLLFRKQLHNHDCSPRSMSAYSDIWSSHSSYSGSFQALIDPQA